MSESIAFLRQFISLFGQKSLNAYVRTAKTVYVFETKLNKTAKKTVAQIIDRHYYEKFIDCGLPIRLIGVNFYTAKGRIDVWKEKEPSAIIK